MVPYEGLTAESQGRGLDDVVERLQTRLTSEQISLLDADAVLARIIPGGSLEQLIFRVDALHWIENRGVRVVNSPRAIERSVDKFYTTTLLHDAGLLVPETVVCERVEEAMAAVRAMGDVVIKPIFGSLGHGMVRVSDPETALRVVRALEQIKSVFYVQRAIDHGGRDLRVFVVGGRVIGAIERRAPAGEWRTNVAIGGSATAVEVSPEIERIALSAAAAVGADYAGVDVLPARDGSLFVLEVNGIPGWQGLQQATGIDVAAVDRRARRAMRAVRDGLRAPRGAVAGMSGVYRDLAAALLAVDRDHRPVNVGLAAQLACLLEVSAPKPGNVSPGRHFADLRYEDFLASALAIGEPMAGAGEREHRRDGAAGCRGHRAVGRDPTPTSGSCCCSRRLLARRPSRIGSREKRLQRSDPPGRGAAGARVDHG